MDEGEDCDDGNTVTEECDYGVVACTVCAADCSEIAGATSICGDGIVDEANGEECDGGGAPGGNGCNLQCRFGCPLDAFDAAPPAPAPQCRALNFNGAFPQYVDAPYNSPRNCNTITMEAWVNTVPHGAGRSRYLLDSRDDSRDGVRMNVDPDEVQCWIHGRGENADFNVAFPMNQWTHIACVFDGDEKRVYINGRLAGARPFDGQVSWDTRGPIRFGQSTFLTANEQMAGQIDEVRISTVARYVEDFDPAVRFQADPVTLGLWHFDEGVGRSTADWSGHNFNGNFINNVGWVNRCPE